MGQLIASSPTAAAVAAADGAQQLNHASDRAVYIHVECVGGLLVGQLIATYNSGSSSTFITMEQIQQQQVVTILSAVTA